MFVKVYEYHIQPDKENEYLEIQEEAEKIYGKFAERRAVNLKSKEDDSKWIEIHWYKDEASYLKSIEQINEQKEIHDLYKKFLGVLVSEKDLGEEDFEQVLETHSLKKI
jgi:hypothetical protein